MRQSGIEVVAQSRWYRSAPQPPSDQPWFVNGVAAVETDLDPAGLLEALHRVRLEKETYGVVAAHLLRLCLSAAEGQGDAAALGQRQRAHRMLALGLAMLGDTADDVAKVASGKGQFKDGKSGAPLDAPKVYKGAAAFLTAWPVDSFRA